MSTYTVRSGDTLSAIAARYRTTASALASANRISNPNLIKVGQKLTVGGQTKVAASSTSVPAQTLKRGSSGAAVKQLQTALVKLKFMTQAQMNTGPGVFGQRTEAAVKAFQKAHKLTADGVFGPKTRAALEKAVAKPAPTPPKPPSTPPPSTLPAVTLKKGATGANVKTVQSALVKLGYMTQAQMNTGPGIYGQRTEAAVSDFQRLNKLTADGVFGPKTRAALEKALAGNVKKPEEPKPPPPKPGSGLTLSQLKTIMPNLADAKARAYLPLLNAAMAEAGINTKQRKAMFVAQLAHESGEFRYFEEIASGAAYEGRKDLGNIYPGDGKRYKGRGPIQITGRYNYRAAGKALGLPLEQNPTMASEPKVGFRIAAWYWNSRGLNTYADRGDFREVTRRINGGYNGLAARTAYYNRALNVL